MRNKNPTIPTLIVLLLFGILVQFAIHAESYYTAEASGDKPQDRNRNGISFNTELPVLSSCYCEPTQTPQYCYTATPYPTKYPVVWLTPYPYPPVSTPVNTEPSYPYPYP